MIRRWSHINSINSLSSFFNNSEFFFFKLKKKSKFINFQSSVSLKRFNKKYTKFKRKALNRVKHLKTWFIYHNIFKFWSTSYLYLKHYYKFQYLNKIFVNNNLFFNFNFSINLNPNVFYNWNFLFFNLNNKLKLTNFKNKSFLWFVDFPSNTPLNIPFYYYNNDVFPHFILNDKKLKTVFNQNDFYKLISAITVKKTIFFYKILIFLLINN